MEEFRYFYVSTREQRSRTFLRTYLNFFRVIYTIRPFPFRYNYHYLHQQRQSKQNKNIDMQNFFLLLIVSHKQKM